MTDATNIRITAHDYFVMDDLDERAELIQGVLIMSPPPIVRHQEIAFNAASLLREHAKEYGGKAYSHQLLYK